MKSFEYVSPTDAKQVAALLSGDAVVMAGGSDLLDLIKEGILTPSRVVNLKNIPELRRLTVTRNNSMLIGATVTLTELLENSEIRQRYPALATAALEAGPPQVRNVGTVGGELCQRPHCYYFRIARTEPCTRRGGAQCPAATADGLSKWHAVFDNAKTPDVSASDLAPALIAYGATVKILGPDGERRIPLEQFYVNDPKVETVLKPKEIVIELMLTNPPAGTKGHFIKFKERDSYDFALVSVTVVTRTQGGVVSEASVVLGGVAPTPWRSKEAEAALKGKPLNEQVAIAAGEAAVKAAKPLKDNGYKMQLVRTLIKRAALATA